MKPITFTTSILSVTVLGAALLALGSISFSSTPGEMSKITYTGNLWCVSNLVQETDASGSLVYADSGLAKNDPRLKGRENLIRREQVTGETQEEVETKATKAGLWEKSNKDELRAALDKKNAEGDNFFTHHFNQGATHPGPCVGSGTGQQEGLWINDAINQECFGSGSEANNGATTSNGTSGTTGQTQDQPASASGVCTGGKGVPEAYASIFSGAGKKFGVNPAWIAAIFAAENGIASGRQGRISVGSSSSWPSANRSWGTSSAGALGPMQFMPGTWPGHAQDGNGDGKKDVQNLYDAIYAGAHYIKNTAGVSGNKPDSATLRRSAIAYNAGPGRVNNSDSSLPYETQTYILKTKEAFSRYNCP